MIEKHYISVNLDMQHKKVETTKNKQIREIDEVVEESIALPIKLIKICLDNREYDLFCCSFHLFYGAVFLHLFQSRSIPRSHGENSFSSQNWPLLNDRQLKHIMLCFVNMLTFSDAIKIVSSSTVVRFR